MERRRQHGDVAGHLAEAEILHQHLSERLERVLLILPVHGRAGIDDIAQGGMVVRVDGGVLGQQLDDRRHREQVRHAPALHQCPGLVDIEAVARQKDRLHRARHLHELMDPRPMRERRDHQRGIRMGRAGHQVAEMVRDHEGHLAMGEHGGLRAPGRAGGEEEPARIVVLHARHGNGLGHVVLHKRVVVFAETRAPDGDHEADRRCCLPHGRGVLGKVAVADHAGRAARLRQIGDLVRRLAEVRRHPDGAEPEAGEHRFEHLVAVLGLHQHAVSLSDPLCGKRCRHRIDAPVEIRPCPVALAPDEADLVRMPARRLP